MHGWNNHFASLDMESVHGVAVHIARQEAEVGGAVRLCVVRHTVGAVLAEHMVTGIEELSASLTEQDVKV